MRATKFVVRPSLVQTPLYAGRLFVRVIFVFLKWVNILKKAKTKDKYLDGEKI